MPSRAFAIYPNDPGIVHQWYLRQIGAPGAWEYVTGSRNVVVAVLDSGVDIDHPDLKENIWKNTREIPGDGFDNDLNGYVDDTVGWDFILNSSNPRPKYTSEDKANLIAVSHGTIVAGLIASKGGNGIGVSGVVWDAQIMPLRILNNKGLGSASLVVSAIDYAVANRADIINLSLFGIGKSSIIDEAILRAYRAGVIVVAASGNDGNVFSHQTLNLDKDPGTPVCSSADNLDHRIVIGVAATDPLDQKAPFSNYGKNCIDISAPGYSFFSTVVKDLAIGTSSEYGGLFSGSSLAAPLVSGSAALLKSMEFALTNYQVIDLLISEADPIEVNSDWKGLVGQGRINIEKSVKKAIARYGSIPSPIVPKNRPYLLLSSEDRVSSGFWVYSLQKERAVAEKSASAYPFLFLNGISSVMDRSGTIFTLPGKGGGPQIRYFDLLGKVKGQFFVGDSAARFGGNLALVENPEAELFAVGSGIGESGKVSIYTKQAKLLRSFQAYPGAYVGGVRVSVGDVGGGNEPEIVTSTQSGGGPQIRIWSQEGKLAGQFFAYVSGHRAGVKIALGDIYNQDKKKEILAAIWGSRESIIRIFDRSGKLLREFAPFGVLYRGDLDVASVDVNGDGNDEMIVLKNEPGNASIAVFNALGGLLYEWNIGRDITDYFGRLKISAQSVVEP
ncbi:MAG: Peptidase S8 and S53, subtilisin, kexin, sedolisin [Parcubacteria group bacterium Gr01-1014_18]|nr:MAG: Peptidase S8 and S53, subtilisin, kexin, sedolisin [Parcubacteria group bacterium Greene0416_36]TSC81421.1 MAG: Peptidase S8 and S53, subtilisin, kexin, sedolisin [Parcubacteria group bacterium Gr01-1014_18]TSC99019.1 MAG: Peptidase S8 and S53, subtilisin, kexin, sedolisin [Parcubacteria group bacterium Greene1014_20]TSD07300.1 MAG: Peptidase S8 and S53, subtilisin, kexin, sedolisin [Parcubacteria group bacterium Greene0714_2]